MHSIFVSHDHTPYNSLAAQEQKPNSKEIVTKNDFHGKYQRVGPHRARTTIANDKDRPSI